MGETKDILSTEEVEWAYLMWCLGYTQEAIAEELHTTLWILRRAFNGKKRQRLKPKYNKALAVTLSQKHNLDAHVNGYKKGKDEAFDVTRHMIVKWCNLYEIDFVSMQELIDLIGDAVGELSDDIIKCRC